MTPSKPATSSRSSHFWASPRSCVTGEMSKGSFSTVFRRSSMGFPWVLPSQSRTSKTTKPAGISAESLRTALGRVEPHLERVEVEAALSLDDDLAVERGALRQPFAELDELREVAQERPAVAAPEVHLTVRVLEDAAEAVPLRLVLPAVALGKLVHQLRLHGRVGRALGRFRLGLRLSHVADSARRFESEETGCATRRV